jgi:thymidylate synthase
MFGFIQFNKEIIAAGVAAKTGRTVELGRLNWHADSYHIYGKDIDSAQKMLFDRVDSVSFEERVYNFHDEFIQEMFNGAEAGIREKIKSYDENH